MSLSQRYDLPDLTATTAFGHRLAAQMFPGAVVALVGQLGAGKTHLVRAIAEGLHIAEPRAVSSPTFVLIQEYLAALPIFHFDAYRLPTVGAFLDLGVEEYYQSQGVCLIEWADRVTAALPAEYLRIDLGITGPTTRQLTLTAHGARYEELLHAL